MKRLIFTLLLFFIAVTTVAAQQPYRFLEETPERMYIRQGSVLCGSTCWAMIFKYYKHNEIPNGNLFSDEECQFGLNFYGYLWPNCCIVNECPDDFVCRTKETDPIIEWVHQGSRLVSDGMMINAAENIYLESTPKNLNLYLTYFAGYSTKNKTEKKRRMDFFFNEFLENNIPVIIHLQRFYRNWIWGGHYVVLVGWDKSSGKVYYMNPSKKNKLYSTSYYKFINKKFYKSGSWWSPSARWDGRGVTFYSKTY